MESIVLHSDIARLVLGYLANNNLKRAAKTLCRTSPYLQQEFAAFKRGLQPHNFLNGGLEDIICEHVKITAMVENELDRMSSSARVQLQQMRLSDRVSELIKMESPRKSHCTHNASTQHKRRRLRRLSTASEEEDTFRRKRPRFLAPHLYCSIDRSSRQMSVDKDSIESSSATDHSSSQAEDAGLDFHGPNNNSTPRTVISNESDRLMPMPQAMPELAKAIMTNEDFQSKLLNNINVALQSVTVHAPTVDSTNAEAVFDDIVKNILEATEKDPSFDKILQDVFGLEAPQQASSSQPALPVAAGEAAIPVLATTRTEARAEPTRMKPLPQIAVDPPQTPLIIRTAVASVNASVAQAEGNDGNEENPNTSAVIQLNHSNSMGTLIDPNFSISKLIVLNSNESAQKQHPQHQPSTSVNISFGSENLMNFADGTDPLGAGTGVGSVGTQVCVDAINGQLTFPMFMSNEGMLSHLPFLVNNEWLAQQLRSDVFANADVSHIEIPLPEPITVAANQLPPNSIIINGASNRQLGQSDPDKQLEPIKAMERSASKASQFLSQSPSQDQQAQQAAVNANAVPASLDSSRVVLERATPSMAGIVNVKAFRSLSTPRKRTSHVRTLNFSPHAGHHVSQHVTPVSTRRLLSKVAQHRMPLLKTAKENEQVQREKLPEPVIINSVEILPNFGSSPRAADATDSGNTPGTGTTTGMEVDAAVPMAVLGVDASGNESSSCVPPLFAMEEGSNQTVIKTAIIASKQPKAASSLAAATPKRGNQKRQPATKSSCKREAVEDQKKQVAAQDEKQPLDDSKENLQQGNGTAPKPELAESSSGEHKEKDGEDKEDLLIVWQRQMQGSSADLEQRLREINAKRQELLQGSRRMSRGRSRPLSTGVAAAKKKSIAASPLATKQKQQKKREKKPPIKSPPSANRKQNNNKKSKPQQTEGEGEFIIKITTPQKPKRSKPKPLQEPKQLKEQMAQKKEQKDQKGPKKQKQKEPPVVQAGEAVSEPQMQPQPEPEVPKQQLLVKQEEVLQQCVNSMSMLLETPFKVSVWSMDGVPPTPAPPALNTPLSKVPNSTFLFGSDTKSILDTPMLTAITPGGIRLTQTSTLGTTPPHSSAAKTDYSSASSYYRPDEADHMDTNAQCALQPTRTETDQVTDTSSTTTSTITTTTIATTTATVTGNIELHAERLPVEPTVLRRVRSFGTEAVDSVEGVTTGFSRHTAELPHYKLVSGLPDAIVDNSSSSSGASSSTFSSSSSSSTSSGGGSSSSSTNNSNTTKNSSVASTTGIKTQLKEEQPAAKTMQMLDMNNLSDISSTEDEEWLKAAVDGGTLSVPPLAIESEPAQLVSQDGEVRYPIRNWLTPSKDVSCAAARAADANTSGEMPPPASAPAPVPAGVPTPARIAAPVPAAGLAAASKKVSPLSQKSSEQSLQRKHLMEVRERVKAKVKQQMTTKARPKKPTKKMTVLRETAELANHKAGSKSPKKPATTIKVEPVTKPTTTQPMTAPTEPMSSSTSSDRDPDRDRDPALLIALNLSAKKQMPKVPRVAMEIAAKPVPAGALTPGQRRGRPKKPSTNIELSKGNTRRSNRLINNKTPVPEDCRGASAPSPSPSLKSSASGSAKVTKKPAKKRAEARLEPTLATLPEVETSTKTNKSEEHLSSSSSSKPLASDTSNDDYELDICQSSTQLASTYSFSYADDGSRPIESVSRPAPSFFENYQMRIVLDNVQHTMRITSPLVHHSQSPSTTTPDEPIPPRCESINSNPENPVSIRNIPKKRMRRISSTTTSTTTNTSSNTNNLDEGKEKSKPRAASTPLARQAESKERDENDLEVAAINTSMKSNAGDEQVLETDDAVVQIEDIESILSHLHGV